MNRKGVILMRYPRGINSDIEELLDEAFNALTDGILIYSPDNIIIKFNKAFSDLMKATNVPCPFGYVATRIFG